MKKRRKGDDDSCLMWLVKATLGWLVYIGDLLRRCELLMIVGGLSLELLWFPICLSSYSRTMDT